MNVVPTMRATRYAVIRPAILEFYRSVQPHNSVEWTRQLLADPRKRAKPSASLSERLLHTSELRCLFATLHVRRRENTGESHQSRSFGRERSCVSRWLAPGRSAGTSARSSREADRMSPS